MIQELDKINFFKRDFKKLSNFYPVNIYFEGSVYPTLEHAFQASKTNVTHIRHKISLLKASDAGKSKKIGSGIKLRSDWENVKVSIMKKLLKQKFSNTEFRDFLLSTGNLFIEEGNYWHDNFWGNCYCKKCIEIEGINQLGKLLMEIRDDIKKQ